MAGGETGRHTRRIVERNAAARTNHRCLARIGGKTRHTDGGGFRWVDADRSSRSGGRSPRHRADPARGSGKRNADGGACDAGPRTGPPCGRRNGAVRDRHRRFRRAALGAHTKRRISVPDRRSRREQIRTSAIVGTVETSIGRRRYGARTSPSYGARTRPLFARACAGRRCGWYQARDHAADRRQKRPLRSRRGTMVRAHRRNVAAADEYPERACAIGRCSRRTSGSGGSIGRGR